MRSTVALGAALALLAGTGACINDGTAVAQPAEGAARDAAAVSARTLSHTARSLLRPRMYRHGDEMESLLWAVITLDFRAAELISARVSAETRIKPATAGPVRPLSVLVPDEFFARERQLFDHAARVLRAAREQDAVATARAYGELVGTCIRCHARYWRGPPSP